MVVDPISNLTSVGSTVDVTAMLVRIIDFLKGRVATAVFTTLTSGAGALEQTELGVSSLADTWLLVRTLEVGGERNRGLYVLKSRGMAHSNQIRELVLSERGIELLDVYTGPGGVVTGAARQAEEARERAEATQRAQEIARRECDLDRRRQVVEAQIATLRAEIEGQEAEILAIRQQERDRATELDRDRKEQARLRHADPAPAPTNANGAES